MVLNGAEWDLGHYLLLCVDCHHVYSPEQYYMRDSRRIKFPLDNQSSTKSVTCISRQKML